MLRRKPRWLWTVDPATSKPIKVFVERWPIDPMTWVELRPLKGFPGHLIGRTFPVGTVFLTRREAVEALSR